MLGGAHASGSVVEPPAPEEPNLPPIPAFEEVPPFAAPPLEVAPPFALPAVVDVLPAVASVPPWALEAPPKLVLVPAWLPAPTVPEPPASLLAESSPELPLPQPDKKTILPLIQSARVTSRMP